MKLKAVFDGTLYHKQISEWDVTPENAYKVLNTILYITDTPLKNLISIEICYPNQNHIVKEKGK